MTTSVSEIITHLKRVLSRRGVNPQDSDDYIQEALIRLEIYQKSNEVRQVKGFLARTVVNLVIDSYRKHKDVDVAPEPVENYTIVDNYPQPDEVYASKQRLQRLSRGFEALDPLTRQIVRAQRVEGLSVAAIAKRHGLSGSAVEKRLAKGLAFLLDWMKEW